MICNPPFNASKSQIALRDTLRFLKDYFGIEYSADRIQACHIFPGTGNDTLYPVVIVKFFIFDEKDTVFSGRWKLQKNRNELNGKFNNLNEKFPKYEAEIKVEANKKDS